MNLGGVVFVKTVFWVELLMLRYMKGIFKMFFIHI